MTEQNTDLNKLEIVVRRYKDKFNTEEAPMFLMMESTEDYIEELEKAIRENKPIREDGKDRPKFDIVY